MAKKPDSKLTARKPSTLKPSPTTANKRRAAEVKRKAEAALKAQAAERAAESAERRAAAAAKKAEAAFLESLNGEAPPVEPEPEPIPEPEPVAPPPPPDPAVADAIARSLAAHDRSKPTRLRPRSISDLRQAAELRRFALGLDPGMLDPAWGLGSAPHAELVGFYEKMGVW